MNDIKTIYIHIDTETLPFSKELTHSDSTFSALPEYANCSFLSIKKYTKEEPIIITDLKPFAQEINDFFNLCKKGFPSFYKDKFWLVTLLRLYVLFLYVNKNNIKKFVHLEYDNLIYYNYDCLQKLPTGLYLNKVGPYKGSAGFLYCNSVDRFEKFIKKITQLFEKGEVFVSQFTKYDFLNEMILIDLIHSHTKDIITYFPLLPTDSLFEITQAVFDGASYGQHIAGTPKDPPGYIGLHHYIGQLIHNKTIKVIFDNKPYVIYKDKKYPIFNLHVHSKKLNAFI